MKLIFFFAGRTGVRRLSIVLGSLLLLAAGGSEVLAQGNVRGGSGRVVGADILHPNGQKYDQVLMTGPNVTVAADAGQVVRVSFLDLNDDITQVEFAGQGTLTVQLESASYRPPAAPAKYDQPGVAYVQGRATIRVRDADASTFVSVFSVGRGNAVNQSLFPAGMTYDAMADIQLLQIDGAEIGAVLTGNVRYSGYTGATGITAPDTAVRYRLIVGDIDARESATPLLRIGQTSALAWDAGAVLVAGGGLRQTNRSPIDASAGTGRPLAQIKAVGGTLSSGEAVPPGTLDGQFVSRSPGSVSVNGAPQVARGYLPPSFDEALAESGLNALDFGSEGSIQFSGGNNGTYAIALDEWVDGELVHARLTGRYSYEVFGTNQDQVTFSLTFERIELSAASGSFSGTIQEMARLAGQPLPVRITAAMKFESLVNGTASMTIVYTSGRQDSYSTVFDLDHELDFQFF